MHTCPWTFQFNSYCTRLFLCERLNGSRSFDIAFLALRRRILRERCECWTRHEIMQFMQNIRMHCAPTDVRFNNVKIQLKQMNELPQNELEIWSENRQWQSTVSQLRSAHMSITIYIHRRRSFEYCNNVLVQLSNESFLFSILCSVERTCDSRMQSIRNECAQHTLGGPIKSNNYSNSIIFVASRWVWSAVCCRSDSIRIQLVGIKSKSMVA